MEVVCLSDTHNKHHEINVPHGDVLLHAGDFTESGTKKESEDFLNWFSRQPHPYKIFIAGNHDFYFQKISREKKKQLIPENLYYLEAEALEIEGILFWGSPVSPGDGLWAFNKERGKEIRQHWNKIPHHTQVLLTHTPAYGIMDEVADNLHIGCEELAGFLEKTKVKFHIFGHAHEDYGSKKIKGITRMNASNMNKSLKYSNAPLTFTLNLSSVI